MYTDNDARTEYLRQRSLGFQYAYNHLANGSLTINEIIDYADRECWPLGYTTGLREGLATWEEELAENAAIEAAGEDE
jgi:hypothetical protein